MTHQPFEELLFLVSSREKDSLTWQQRTELQKHLDKCNSCRVLFDAWRDIEQDLGISSNITPKPGFSQRWLMRLEAERDKQLRRNLSGIFAVSAFGGLVLFAFLVFIVFSLSTTPANQIWNIIYDVHHVFTYLEVIFRYTTVIFGTAARIIPFSWFMLFVGVASEMIVMWFILFRIISTPGRLVL